MQIARACLHVLSENLLYSLLTHETNVGVYLDTILVSRLAGRFMSTTVWKVQENFKMI